MTVGPKQKRNHETVEVYTIAKVAERCFLFEALLWIAFRKVPVSDAYPDGEDIHLRLSDEFEGRGYDYAGDYDITPEDCQRVGLPPNPAYVHDVLFEGKVSFDFLISLDEFKAGNVSDDPRRYQQFSDKDIAYARELRDKYYSWREELDFFLMEAKLTLALKLLRGELTAISRYCDDPDKREQLLESGECEIIKHTNAPTVSLPIICEISIPSITRTGLAISSKGPS